MKLCTVEGCERRLRTMGYCQTHYMRLRRQGTLADPVPATLAERFWSKVQQSEGCWEWTAAKNSHGYGELGVDGKNKKAHRISYELSNGPIPEGLLVDHTCHNRSCVNPSHLRVATQKQNAENLEGPSMTSTTGVRGVYKSGNRWRAQVMHNGTIHTAGTHATIAEAEAAVIALRNQLFTHNNLDRQQQQAS